MFSHVTVGSNDFAKAKAFYDATLPRLGLVCVHEEERAIAYGRAGGEAPWFWILEPWDGRPATAGNGSHVAFRAETRAQVDAFHAQGLARGGRDEGAPGPRPHYSENYYGAYLRDPDGNKLQAVCYAAA